MIAEIDAIQKLILGLILNNCPAKKVAAAHPNDPHILERPYSKLYLRPIFST